MAQWRHNLRMLLGSQLEGTLKSAQTTSQNNLRLNPSLSLSIAIPLPNITAAAGSECKNTSSVGVVPAST